MGIRLVILLLAVMMMGCTVIARNLVAHGQAARMLPRFAVCPDGEPIRLLLDRHCPGGVCGYSCLPARWDDP